MPFMFEEVYADADVDGVFTVVEYNEVNKSHGQGSRQIHSGTEFAIEGAEVLLNIRICQGEGTFAVYSSHCSLRYSKLKFLIEYNERGRLQ